MENVAEKIAEYGVVPVIKLNNPQRDALPLAKALIDGGLPVAEVTFRAAGAADAIKMIHEAYPEMILGAGTVLTNEQIDAAVDAGVQFIVTPGLDADLVRYAQSKGVPLFPGCTTPTDYHLAYKLGLSTVKFFPAEQSGGLAKIKAIRAVFPGFKVMPTGGINLNNLADYISCDIICACGGSYMVSADLIDNGKFDEITELCKKSIQIVKETREKCQK